MLDPIQNHALRLCLGACVTTVHSPGMLLKHSLNSSINGSKKLLCCSDKCDKEFKSILSLGRLAVLSGGTVNTSPNSASLSDISVIIIIIIIRWCRVLCVVYVVAITCMRTRDVILLAVAVFCPQHEMMGGNIVLPTSFCYCFVFRGFPSCFTFLRLLLSYLLCVKLQIGFYFTSRCCDHICPSCAPLQFYRGISDSQSQMQSSSETYIMHVTNTSSCVLYSL